jgi:hypothetical protein
LRQLKTKLLERNLNESGRNQWEFPRLDTLRYFVALTGKQIARVAIRWGNERITELPETALQNEFCV